jgi:hypothetical protein
VDHLLRLTRPYWSVGVLVLAAVPLLLLGNESMAAALAGAAIARAFDVSEAATRERQRRRDEVLFGRHTNSGLSCSTSSRGPNRGADSAFLWAA